MRRASALNGASFAHGYGAAIQRLDEPKTSLYNPATSADTEKVLCRRLQAIFDVRMGVSAKRPAFVRREARGTW